MTWYPKKDNPRNWNTRPEISRAHLPEALKSEDRAFEKRWSKYWRQRGKWSSFEEFLKHAA